jgi:hypothetical protein
MHLPLRVRVACAAFGLFVLAGCLVQPIPDAEMKKDKRLTPPDTVIVPPPDTTIVPPPDTIPPRHLCATSATAAAASSWRRGSRIAVGHDRAGTHL